MFGRLAQTLIAFIVALAVMLPVNARAMAMPADMGGMGLHQHCPNCPKPARSDATPDKMPACQVLACGGVVATLPTPILLPGRVLLPAAYLTVPPVRWTAAARAPDPFPPRPIVLV